LIFSFQEKKKNGWGKPENITWQLRRSYLMTSSLSFDGSELYLVYYFPGKSDIYHSVFDGDTWKKAVKLKKPVSSNANETHASISADGRTLYFTSSRDGGYGGLDIYRATLDAKGRWSNVENLGDKINTPFNEETPFITTDGKTLFFSSEGHMGMGGYDIFHVDLENPEQVHNLGYPLNNSYDNLFYYPAGNGREGYLSFYDGKGAGQKDIFLVTLPDDIFHAAEPDQSNIEPLADIIMIADENMTHEDLLQEEDISTADGQPVVEGTLVVDGTPAVESQSVVEGTPAVEIQLAVESQPAVDVQLAVESQPADRLPKTTILSDAGVISYPASPRRTYSVQFLAFSRYGDPGMIGTAGEGAVAHYCGDGITRFISGFHDTYEETLQVLAAYYDQGYGDAFIRVNPFTANYTIQIFAARNPGAFRQLYGLNDILIKKGSDGIYRYSLGIFTSMDEAVTCLEEIKASGFPDAFIRKM
jgi:hypothetical protein